MGSSVRFTKPKVDWAEVDSEFNRGKSEYKEWVRDEKSRRHAASRMMSASDPYEKAFFKGVLTANKQNNPNGFPAPKNWKGQTTGLMAPEKPFVPPYPGWVPRMTKKAKK